MRRARRDTNVSTGLHSRPLAVLAAALAVAFVAAPHASAQAQSAQAPAAKPAEPAKPAPKLAGKPDFTGVWDRQQNPVSQPTARTGGSAQSPTGPQFAGQAPPIKPELKAAYDAEVKRLADAEQRGEPTTSQNTMCLPQGMPAMMLAIFPMEVIQTPKQVTIIEEAFTQVRRILMDKPQKSFEDVEPGFYGHSVGRWDGDTLVVDTIGIKETVRFQNMPHSPQMRIKERMKLVSPNVLWNEITIEDPVVFEKPHTYTVAYRRMPDYTLLEYICEDNREYADDKGRQKIRIN